MARRLYARDRPIPWSDVNLLARWHLNSRRVPGLPIPLDGPERVREIRRRCALLPQALRRDPDFAIASPSWDTFFRWEFRPDRHDDYLGDTDWDRNWVPASSSDDDDEEDNKDGDEEDDFHEHDGQGCVGA
jgi:hypothetical protein